MFEKSKNAANKTRDAGRAVKDLQSRNSNRHGSCEACGKKCRTEYNTCGKSACLKATAKKMAG